MYDPPEAWTPEHDQEPSSAPVSVVYWGGPCDGISQQIPGDANYCETPVWVSHQSNGVVTTERFVEAYERRGNRMIYVGRVG
jgi:hypothetical protein